MVQGDFARRHVLRWIVVSGLILAVPLCYYVAQWTCIKLLHELDTRATDELNVNLAYLRSRMDHLQTMCQIVATDERVLALMHHPENLRLTAEANLFLARLNMAAGSIAFVLNMDGRVLASANWETPDSFVGQNLSFRPYFKASAAGKASQYAAIDSITGRLGYYVSRLIHLKGGIAGVAVTKTDPQDLILPYERQERAFIITDPNGIAIIGSPHSFLYSSIAPLSPQSIERLQKEKPYADISIEPLSTLPLETVEHIHLITFDLDRFKAVNDQYGHSAGDNVLVKVADVILKACRDSDIAIRYGGEELLIFIPSGNSRQVLHLAERIRNQIKDLDLYLNGHRVPITISGGIASRLLGEPLEKLIDRADQMMYLAKKNGRDQIRWKEK